MRNTMATKRLEKNIKELRDNERNSFILYGILLTVLVGTAQLIAHLLT